MLDFQKLTDDAVTKLNSSGKVQEIIEKQVEDTIKSVVRDMFSSYGDFGKSLRKAIEEKIQINPDSFTFERYNQTLLKVAKKQLDTQLKNEGMIRFKELLANMLENPDDEIKLSKLIEMVIEENEEEGQESEWEAPTIFIERDEKSYGNYTHVYLDPKPKVSKYDCEYRIDLSGTEAYAVHMNSSSYNKDNLLDGKKIFTRSLRGVERVLFWLHNKRTKLIVDVTEDQIDNYSYPSRED